MRTWYTSLLLAAVLMILMPGAFLLAQEAGADPAAVAEAAGDDGEKSGNLLMALLTAVLGGAMAAFTGWAKNKNADTGEMEKFQSKYFVATLIVGALVGVAGHFMGLTPDGVVGALEASPIYGMVTFAVEALMKVIWRHGAPQLGSLLGTIKAGGSDPK